MRGWIKPAHSGRLGRLALRARASQARGVTVHALSLVCTDLAPRRGGRTVAAGVSFTLAPGQALVIRGANGAGKTSVLRAVAGLCGYAGHAAFSAGGVPLDPAEARARHTHLLGPRDGLADRLTARETAAFWSGLLGGAPALAEAGLSGAETIPAERLSTGQRRRLGLSRLLGSPRALWLLDEPLSGLDAAGRDLLLGAVADHRAGGGLVLMASHEAGLPRAPVLRLA